MKGLERFLHYVDTTNERVGLAVRYLLLPLATVMLIEVVARYVFDRPTIWAWDTNLQIFGMIILLSGGYTLLHGRHVRIEAITEHLPHRARLFLELISMLMLMFVAIVLLWQGGIDGWESMLEREKLNTIWAPWIFPIKMMYPIAGLLLLFQALAKFIRDLSNLMRGEA